MYLCFPLRSNLYLSNMNVYSYAGTGHTQLWWNLFLWITSVRRFATFIWDKSSHQILPAPTDFTDHWIVLNKSKKTHLFFFTKCKYYFLDMPQVLTSPHVPAPRAHRTRPFFWHISACSNWFDKLLRIKEITLCFIFAPYFYIWFGSNLFYALLKIFCCANFLGKLFLRAFYI